MAPNHLRSETSNPCGHAAIAETSSRVRTCEEFEFVANAPLDRVFPLFGAARERVWAEDWNPQFVWPKEPEDREGMVFRVDHDGRMAVWVNTRFDRGSNRVQYVYVLPDTVATVITLRLTPRPTATHVAVRYERTSLATDADAAVLRMAERDKTAGAEWAAQINGYFARGDLTGKR